MALILRSTAPASWDRKRACAALISTTPGWTVRSCQEPTCRALTCGPLYSGVVQRPQGPALSGVTGRPVSDFRRRAVLPTHWSDFSLIAVDCATSDPAQIARVLASIPAAEWAAMEAALRQVPTPYKPGLYKVDLPDHLLWPYRG